MGRHVFVGDGVDGMTRLVGSFCVVGIYETSKFDELFRIGFLIHKDRYVAVVVGLSLKFDAEEVGGRTIPVDSEASIVGDATFEFFFDEVTGARVNEIVDVETHPDGGLARDDGTSEYAGGIRKGLEAYGLEGAFGGFVPVPRASF